MVKLSKHKIGDLLEIKRGASLSGQYYATEGRYIRLTCGNFDYVNNCFKENTSKDDIFFTGAIRDEFIMKKGDIITPLTEQAIGLLGSTAIIPEDDKYIQSQDVAKIICKEGKLYPKFAYYLISSDAVKKQLSAGAQQTKIRHTSPDKIKDCIVWIPDYQDQIVIGNFLSTIDTKLSLNRRINERLEQVARQLYDYWFVQFDFPDANGNPYRTSGGKMIYNDQLKREIPEGWEIKEDLCPVITGKEDANFATPNGRYKYFTCAIESMVCDTPAFKGNAILIAGNGNFNVKHYNGEFNAYQRTYVLIPDSKYYAALFFAAESKINSFIKGSNGSIIKFITKGDVERIYVLEQPKDQLYEELNKYILLIEQIESESDHLTTLRDRLLPLLMNGQVTIKD